MLDCELDTEFQYFYIYNLNRKGLTPRNLKLLFGFTGHVHVLLPRFQIMAGRHKRT